MRRRKALCINAAIAAALFTCNLTFAGTPNVPVQQVEAEASGPNSSNEYTEYAPVDFAGHTSITNSSFPGITFYAYDPNVAGGNATTNTLSGHATGVADHFYGPGTPAGSSSSPQIVTTVYADSADRFVNGFNIQGIASTSAPAPAANEFPTGVLVSNNSYVDNAMGDGYPAEANQEEDLRVDYLVSTNNVTLVAGVALNNVAYGSPGGYQNATGIYSAFNVIAVRGNTSSTPYEPQYLSSAITVDRLTPDLYQQNDSSYATGTVSGYAAALIGNAQSLNLTDGTQHQVVKSLLMTGATRQGLSDTGASQAWAASTPNNLDPLTGAGQANYNNSLSILNGGERPSLTITAGAVASTTVSTASSGWTYAQSVAGGKTAILFDVTSTAPGLVATLNWDVSLKTNPDGTIDTVDSDLIFPHLDLQLLPATFDSATGKYVLGSAYDYKGLNSADDADNIQSLYDAYSLTPGVYALVVTGDSTNSVNYGLSYDLKTLPIPASIPEPATFSLLAISTMSLLARRRHRRPR